MTVDDGTLRDVVHAALGSAHRVAAVTALRGGSKKGVHRITCADGTTVIAYLWDDAHDHWPADNRSGPLSHASGARLFVAAHERLTGVGVRVPDVVLVDVDRRWFPADIAIVEDVPGPSLQTVLDTDPSRADAVLDQLADQLERLHRTTDRRIGRIADLADGRATDTPCEQLVLADAMRNVRDAAARDARVRDARESLEARLLDLASAVRPRAEHGLVHGELGPDHVLLDRDGRPVLVDIESAMHFDVEWEHAYLRIRFGDRHAALRRVPLDDARLALCELAHRLSLVAGPMRLLDGSFPHRAAMLEIVEHNLAAALAPR